MTFEVPFMVLFFLGGGRLDISNWGPTSLPLIPFGRVCVCIYLFEQWPAWHVWPPTNHRNFSHQYISLQEPRILQTSPFGEPTWWSCEPLYESAVFPLKPMDLVSTGFKEGNRGFWGCAGLMFFFFFLFFSRATGLMFCSCFPQTSGVGCCPDCSSAPLKSAWSQTNRRSGYLSSCLTENLAPVIFWFFSGHWAYVMHLFSPKYRFVLCVFCIAIVLFCSFFLSFFFLGGGHWFA